MSLSESNYYTEKPSSNDSIVVKSITIVRSGDLSRKSVVRISTSDGTAIGGRDYKSKTDIISFEPGVSALDFDINILYGSGDEKEALDFKVFLGPQDPVAAIFGKIKSSIIYINNNLNSDMQIYSDPLLLITERLPSLPYLISMKDLPANEVLKDFLETEQKLAYASSSYPLICIHVSGTKAIFFLIILLNILFNYFSGL